MTLRASSSLLSLAVSLSLVPGCTVDATHEDVVESVETPLTSCSKNRVFVCHATGAGDEQTQCVNRDAAANHGDHGDLLCACDAVTTAFVDADGDGFGAPGTLTRVCPTTPGFVQNDGDCDDSSSLSHPGAAEACNGADDDCDGALPSNESDSDDDGIVDCAEPHTLTVSMVGSGSVSSSTEGIGCTDGSGDCSELYDFGTNVTLNAAPTVGWAFLGWTADCVGSDPSSSVVLDEERACGAEFGPTLLLNIVGNGSVRFSDGRTCTGPCATAWSLNETIYLSPIPDEGSRLSFISCPGAFTMDAPHSCFVIFEPA